MSAQNLKSNLNVAINICLEQEHGHEHDVELKVEIVIETKYTKIMNSHRNGQRQPWTCLNKHKILAKVTAQVQIGSLC